MPSVEVTAQPLYESPQVGPVVFNQSPLRRRGLRRNLFYALFFVGRSHSFRRQHADYVPLTYVKGRFFRSANNNSGILDGCSWGELSHLLMSDAVSNWRACLNSRCRALLSLGILLAACVDFRARSARRSSNVPTCLARLCLLIMGYFPGPPSLIRRLVSCSVCPLVAIGTRRLVNRPLPYTVGRGDARAPLQANLLFGA